ncbi:AMP-binding protein [Streptosporangium sp. NPDC049644]|uniref:AMP-binding protein n=1 Tax=Streptosporangium sp. NPDC049644 TaxID=3155507 RepID=UPI00344A56DD
MTMEAARPASDAERALLDSWRGRSVDLGEEQIATHVLRHAQATPAAVAVRGADRDLSYAELDQESGDLARVLRTRKAGPGSIVAIDLPRGVDLVVAMLAVLRTGAAYCAMDVRWPVARRQEVIKRIGAELVVVGPGGPRRHLGAQEVPSASGGSTRARNGTDPCVGVGLDAACCVYFTSGSTGEPKAALSTHRAVLRTILPIEPDYPDVPVHMSATAAVSWDIFTFEIWYPLVHGGTTNLATTGADGYPSPQGLRQGIARGVNGAVLTMALFNLLVDEDVDAFTGLGTLIIGGERASPRHVRDFLLRHPTIPLVNAYGPVEASVFATTHRISLADCDSPRGIPIGRAIPNTGLLVVRFTGASTATRVAVGEVGELLISGDGLAAGYIGEDAGTGAFTPIAVDGEAPVRVYRTGDLVSWRADGVLEFIGRADRQLKISGQRVEPAEVEASLLATGKVRKAVVVPVFDGERASGLAAYVTAVRAPLDGPALMAALRERLPAAMLPQSITELREFPLSLTGKVDVAALPAPTNAPVEMRAVSADPMVRGLAETVGRTAAEVLGLDALGLDTDLRSIGLDSLAAIRLSHRLLDLGIGIGADVVLRAGSAVRIARESAAGNGSEAISTIAEAGGLSDAQISLWLDGLMRPEHAIGNVLVLAYRLVPAPPAEALADALSTFVARHEATRTAIDTDQDGLPVAKALDRQSAVTVSIEKSSPPIPTWRRAHDLARRIDLARGPLVAARIDSAPGGCDLTISIHHACFDGYSVAVLADELSTLLGGATPPPPRRFTDMRNPALDRPPADELRKWTSRLSTTRDIEWPSSPPPVDGGRYGTAQMKFPGQAGARLAAKARAHHLTPFVLALRAFASTVRHITGASDFCVGVPTAGRDDPRTRGVVGYLVRQVVVPIGPAELDGTLDALSDTWNRARAVSGLGVAELARLSHRTGRGRSSLFQVQFAWQNTIEPVWRIPGVRVTPMSVQPIAAQFDLTMELTPLSTGEIEGEVEHDIATVPSDLAQAIAEDFVTRLNDL